MATQEVEKVSDFRRDIKVSREMNERLESLMLGLGIRTKTEALKRLLSDFGKNNPGLTETRIASFENIMREAAPVCIFGLPGSGKSTTLRSLVLEAHQSGMNCILVDIANEHSNPSNPMDPFKKKIKASSAANKRFGKGLYRIVVDKDPKYRDLSIERLFENLNVLAFKGKLQDFFIAIDEGNEFSGIKALRDFVIESRKFTKKVVIVSADPEPYSKICVVMRPRPNS